MRAERAGGRECAPWRPELQGLRAVAVVLVVGYHAGVPGLSGGYVGVDAFFVLSGFLITGQLLRELQTTGRVRLRAFWARRVRRLLPPAALVVLLTLLASRLWSPFTDRADIGRDGTWAALDALNVRLARQGVDYLHAGASASPFQHLWSLNVEEQFYVGWPLLLVLGALLAARLRRPGVLLTGLVASVVTASFVCSVLLTSSNAPLAYFSLPSRAWELGAGALLALAAGHLHRVPGRGLLAAAGLATLVVAAAVLDDASAFPGTLALLPVLATVAVVAGPQGSAVARLLTRRPLQAVGRWSYAWYLWHWPVLVLVPQALGAHLSWPARLGLGVLALGPAALTTRIVERPLARRPLRVGHWWAAGLGLTATTAVATLVVVATLPSLVGPGPATDVPVRVRAADASWVQTVRGLVARSTAAEAVPSNLAPALLAAGGDVPETSRTGSCHASYLVVEQGECAYGDVAATRTVVVFGDSHAEQWQPGLARAGLEQNWRVVNWTKAACTVADVTPRIDELRRDYTECDTWRDATVARILALHPALVITSQSDDPAGVDVTDAAWSSRTDEVLSRLTSAGLPVDYLLDTVEADDAAPACVAGHLTDVRSCDLVPAASPRRTALVAGLRATGVRTVDTSTWTCSTTACPVVVGNLLVYRDASHLTATYSRWLAPLLGDLFPGAART